MLSSMMPSGTEMSDFSRGRDSWILRILSAASFSGAMVALACVIKEQVIVE
jgi:hypothetical protein